MCVVYLSICAHSQKKNLNEKANIAGQHKAFRQTRFSHIQTNVRKNWTPSFLRPSPNITASFGCMSERGGFRKRSCLAASILTPSPPVQGMLTSHTWERRPSTPICLKPPNSVSCGSI